MNCRYCGATNTEHDHRCARCGRRLYLASARSESFPAASRLAVAPSFTHEASPVRVEDTAFLSEPLQASLFPSMGSTRERLRIVEMPPGAARRDALDRAAAPSPTRSYQTPTPAERAHARAQQRMADQQRLAFPSPAPHDLAPPDSTIYCDAPVALPPHRAMAAALDGSMMLISLGIFLIIFHLAGAKVVLNKATLPFYGFGSFVTLTLYRLLWVFANTDSIGMRWSGLKLVTFDGLPPQRAQRFHRFLTSYIGLMAGGLGLFWALVDEEKLTWHDHMSKTFPTPRMRLLRYPKR